MKIVVDTSVVIAVITNEEHKKSLITKTKGAHLIAPSSLPLEIGNAVSALFKRNRINLEQANLFLDAFDKIPIQLFNVNLPKSIDIAHNLNVYAYDAYFIECAQANNTPLLSIDQRLIESARKFGIKYIEV